VEDGDGRGFGWDGLFLSLQHGLEQSGDGALAFCDRGDFGAGGEDAEGGVDGDLFYGLGFGDGFGGGLEFGEIEAGDLEAVEEESGTAGVDVVGRDALEDLADGVLDGRLVFGERDVEGGAAAVAGACVGGGFTGGVVVVAEVFSAEAWAAAAAAVGEDVAALVALGCFDLRLDCVVHWSPPHGVLFGAKSSEEKG
jgi:hypothetical protein